jgi:DNA polymerase-3 subunit epsilon
MASLYPLAFVDLETTGASATRDRITEIGIVLVDEHGVHEWSQLIHPQTRIPVFIEQMTGITNSMVADAPLFSAVAAEVDGLLKGRLFITHNARFDYGFLKNEFKRMGLTFQPSVLCTVKLSRTLYPEHRHHTLVFDILRRWDPGFCMSILNYRPNQTALHQ